jgi:hypothetical protein
VGEQRAGVGGPEAAFRGGGTPAMVQHGAGRDDRTGRNGDRFDVADVEVERRAAGAGREERAYRPAHDGVAEDEIVLYRSEPAVELRRRGNQRTATGR